MGRTADDRLTVAELSLAFLRKADAYAQEEKMPIDIAIQILSGRATKPYGTPTNSYK